MRSTSPGVSPVRRTQDVRIKKAREKSINNPTTDDHFDCPAPIHELRSQSHRDSPFNSIYILIWEPEKKIRKMLIFYLNFPILDLGSSTFMV
jgi:hypothetical protein